MSMDFNPTQGTSSRLARHRASMGRQAMMSLAAPAPAAPVAPAPFAPKATTRTITSARLAPSPVEMARSDARARFSNVMRSDAVKGRERQARALLLASCDRDARFATSTAIIAELRSRPTDAEADRIAAEQARAAKVEAILAAQRSLRGSAAQANRAAGFNDDFADRALTASEQSMKRAVDQANRLSGFGE